MATKRNDSCPCGSGLKYKKCCLITGGPKPRSAAFFGIFLAVAAIGVALAVGYWIDRSLGILTAIAGLGGVGAYVMFSDPPQARDGGDPSSINFGG